MQEFAMNRIPGSTDPSVIMPTFAPIPRPEARPDGMEFCQDQLDGDAWWRGELPGSEEVYYLNSGTCPECSGGMVRLGTCFSCPVCGYGSCGG
jgi:hypothetical protein